MLRAVLTIPVDEAVTAGVMDDLDDEGRKYSVTVDGPETFVVEYHEDGFWIAGDQALAIHETNVPDEWITEESETQ